MGSNPEKSTANVTVFRSSGIVASASAAVDAPCEKPSTPSNGPSADAAPRSKRSVASQPRTFVLCAGRTRGFSPPLSPSRSARLGSVASASSSASFSPISHHALGPTGSASAPSVVPSADRSASSKNPAAECGASRNTNSTFDFRLLRTEPVFARKVSAFWVKPWRHSTFSLPSIPRTEKWAHSGFRWWRFTAKR